MPAELTPAIPTSLAGAPWLTRPETRAVLDALAKSGHEARIVGGTVRNALLGEPVTDVDIATTATPDETLAAARAAGLDAIPTGAEHGTVTVIANRIPFEVTTLREDVETFGRHARVAFTANWEADARRRDFTINALYCDCDGNIADPLGGVADLAARHVRFIGDARERIREDALRILRFFRFHARYGRGELNSDGLEACAQERALLANLSAERVRSEILKLLEAPGAAPVIATMLGYGFLANILGRAPRSGLLARVVARDCDENRTVDPLVRLSVLAVAVEEDVGHLATRLRLSRKERDALIVVDSRLAALPTLDARARRRSLYRHGAERWQRMAVAGASASDTGEAIATWKEIATLPDRWTIPTFPLRGSDVLALGVPAGPQVGAVLADIESEWIDEDFAADAATLRSRLAARVAAFHESY